MQSRLYAHPWTRAYICALFLPDQCLRFPSDRRSSGCGLFQELSHQSLSVHVAPSHSPVSVESQGYLAFFAALHHFLPSFLVCAGTLSLHPHSCLLALPAVNFASFPFPLYVALEAALLYFVMLKTRREAGGYSVYLPLDSTLLPCPFILSLPSLTLF